MWGGGGVEGGLCYSECEHLFLREVIGARRRKCRIRYQTPRKDLKVPGLCIVWHSSGLGV